MAEGTPEYLLFQQIGKEGINKKEVNPEILKQGQNHCMKNKWITVDKGGHMTRLVDTVVDADRTHLQALVDQQPLDSKIIEALKKRKTIAIDITKYFQVTKGELFALER